MKTIQINIIAHIFLFFAATLPYFASASNSFEANAKESFSSIENQFSTKEKTPNFTPPPDPSSLPRNMPHKIHDTKQAPENDTQIQYHKAKMKEKSKSTNSKNSAFVEQLIKQNYKFYKAPEAYYNLEFSGQNLDLPPVYFKSYYIKMIEDNVEKDHLNGLRALLDDGINLNLRLGSNDTLLIRAADKSSYNVARYLITKKIDINAKNDYGLTALHVSSIKGDDKMAKILLTMGADFTIRDNDGYTPFDYANMYENNSVIMLFERYFDNIEQRLLTNSHYSHSR